MKIMTFNTQHCLNYLEQKIDFSVMAKAILDKFFNAYLNIRTPDKYLSYYSKKFILRDVRIKYILNGKKRYCKVVGINPQTHALTVRAAGNKLIDIKKPSDIVVPRKIKLPKPKHN